MKTLFILSISLLTALSVAFAEDSTNSLSLEAAIQEGTGQSPTLKKFQSSKEEASWGKLLGLSTLLPHLDFKAKHDFGAEYESVPVTLGGLVAPVPIVYPRTSYGLEANWVVFDGFANVKNYQASLDLAHAAELDYSRKGFEIRKRIQLAYFNALAAIRFEEVAEENVKTLQENLSQVKHRLESGVATEYDVLRVEVRMSDAQTELERTKDNVVIERRNLAQAMGKADDGRSLNGTLPSPELTQKIKDLREPAPDSREDYQATLLRSQASDLQAGAARGALIPSIGLQAHYEKYENTDYPGQAYGGFRDAWEVGVYAKWSILDGGASIAKSGIAHARADRAAHEYRESVLALPADFELWKRRYLYSAHRFDSKNEDLKRSEESFRISTLSFQQGRKTITDVLEAESDLFRARAGVVQSQLEAEQALVQLELTLGKEI